MTQEKGKDPKAKDEVKQDEIPDADLDKVVGAGLASIPVGNVIKIVNSFGGEDWERK